MDVAQPITGRVAFVPRTPGPLTLSGAFCRGEDAGQRRHEMDFSPIAVITSAILLVGGTVFAFFLGVSSNRIEASRPH